MNIKKFLNQTAVYWGSPVPAGMGGFTYGEPVEVKVRWSDKQEKFLTGNPGGSNEEILSSVVVLSETDFEVNGRLLLGKIDDLSSDQDADENRAMVIRGFAKIPNKRATQFLRKTWLV